MVNFSRRWNGDGCFSRTMEWRWSLQNLTITINGSWQDQPLAAMVFQWFFPFLGTNGSRWLLKGNIRDKTRIYKDVNNRNLSENFPKIFFFLI